MDLAGGESAEAKDLFEKTRVISEERKSSCRNISV